MNDRQPKSLAGTGDERHLNDGTIDRMLQELAKEWRQGNMHGMTRRIVASILLQDKVNHEEDEKEDEENKCALPVVLEERCGFVFVQSIGADLFRKTRIRPGQLVIRLNNIWFQHGDTLLQELQGGDDEDWKEWWTKHGTEKNGRLRIETVEGWGSRETRVVTHLIQVEKSSPRNDDDNDDNNNNDNPPIPLGLSFQKQACGHIWLTRIAPTGLFHQALRTTTDAGSSNLGNLPLPCSVILVNGVPCPQSTPEVIKQLTDTAPMVSIECREIGSSAPSSSTCTPAPTTTTSTTTTTATTATTTMMEPVVDQVFTVILEKPSATTPLGISLRKSVAANSIFIAGLARNSISTRSTIPNHAQLEVGQKLLEINGRPCPSSTAETVKVLQQLQGRVELKVATIDWSRTLAMSAAAEEDENKLSSPTDLINSQNSDGSLLTRLQSYLVRKETSP